MIHWFTGHNNSLTWWGVHMFGSGHSLGIPWQTSHSPVWTQEVPAHYCHYCRYCCDLRSWWPVTANEKQTKFLRRNCPHLCAVLHYPWHFNGLLNYFQICVDSWFIQRSTHYKRNRSNNTYLKTNKSECSPGGAVHNLFYTKQNDWYSKSGAVFKMWCKRVLSGSRSFKSRVDCEDGSDCSPVRTGGRLFSSSLSQTAGPQSITDGALSDHGSDQGISSPD